MATVAVDEWQPFLVDWWDLMMAREREARELDHQQRLLSPELLGMYNQVHTYRWVLDESGSNPFKSRHVTAPRRADNAQSGERGGEPPRL